MVIYIKVYRVINKGTCKLLYRVIHMEIYKVNDILL
jgi:hypothetical protein